MYSGVTMADYHEVFVAMRQAAKELGWALFEEHAIGDVELETHLLKIIDVRSASFSFDYNEFVKEIDDG